MAQEIPEAPFSERIFGFVYPIGTKMEPLLTTFTNYLVQYGYQGCQSRMSEQLRSMELGISFDDASPYGKRDALIRAGNEARVQAKDDRILAVMAVSDIASRRALDEQQHPTATLHTAHIVRSFKRPEEVALFREIYKSGFYLIGATNDDDAQMEYLTKELGIDENMRGL